ncbi:MAG: Fe2+-dependent dioxygenase [Alphaproteobacteria bacterium]
MYRIADVLPDAELDAIREALADPSLFEDGRLTAGWSAKGVKNNLQLALSPLERGLVEKVEKALLAHPVFQAAAIPKTLIRTRLSRYEHGMTYGWHIDDPLIERERTDLAFTLFLSDPSTYEGGALLIDASDGESEIKLPAGQVFLYPATTLHQVEPVTSGVRLAAFGWVRSYVRRADQREILFDLDLACRKIFAEQGKSPFFDSMSKTKANLMRLWIED